MTIETVEKVNPAIQEEIATFLKSASRKEGACAEHDPRWLQVLSDALGHRPFMLVSRTGDGSAQINGYLPLALVKSTLFGRFLVSLPYLNRAGVIARDEATATALLEEVVKLANKLNVQYLELRHHALTLDDALITHSRDNKVRMVRALPDSPETLFKEVGPKVRNQVRKGEKSGLSIRWDGETLLNDFYTVFTSNMRDLGTPVYSSRLFSAILQHFSEEAELAVVYQADKPIAGALLVHDDHLEQSSQVPSASCLRSYNHTNANMWMYHQLLLRAMARGSKAFDFGRSSEDSGTYRFKKQWGALPHPTVWQYHLIHGELDVARPDNPRMQRRIEMWKKLPLWITRLIGPGIVRGIP